MIKLRFYYPAFIWSLIILILSAIPGKDLPSFSFFDFLKSDKIGHFAFYGVLSFLIICGDKWSNSLKSTVKSALFSVIITATYGILMELMQGAFFESRIADINDAIANTIGAIVGLWVFFQFPIFENKGYFIIKKLGIISSKDLL